MASFPLEHQVAVAWGKVPQEVEVPKASPSLTYGERSITVYPPELGKPGGEGIIRRLSLPFWATFVLTEA